MNLLKVMSMRKQLDNSQAISVSLCFKQCDLRLGYQNCINKCATPEPLPLFVLSNESLSEQRTW